ncbi:MAG TPA: hypothetical protein VFL86_02770, partial [Burkholderiaceae bacterium]|nr:hypothetical protein [Burkholderiaceae bacterium]
MHALPSHTGLPRPGLLYGPYPQRRAPAAGTSLAGAMADVADLAGDTLMQPLHGRAPDFDASLRTERKAARSDQRPFDERVAAVRAELARHGLAPALVA